MFRCSRNIARAGSALSEQNPSETRLSVVHQYPRTAGSPVHSPGGRSMLLLPHRNGFVLLSLLALSSTASLAQITTSQVDNARTGANLHETILTRSEEH